MSEMHFPLKPLVLVINDDEPTRRLLKMAVRGEGWRCEDASGTEDGWAMLSRMGVDAVVLDVALSTEDGLKFLGRMRAAGMRQPIIYLTGGRIHELDLVHEAGTFTALVRKPADVEQLMGVLREGFTDSSQSQVD